MAKKRVMVLLIGGRLTPNFIGVLGYPPDAVECVVSEDELTKYRDTLEVLSSLPGCSLPPEPRFPVPAFDMRANLDTCRQIVALHPDAEIIFNVTCASKIMGIAAYDIARQSNHCAIYVDTAHSRFIDLTSLEEKPIPSLSIDDYLKFFGRASKRTFDPSTLSISEGQALQAANYLASAGPEVMETVAAMRSAGQGKGTHTMKLKVELTDAQWQVLSQLEQFDLLTNLTRLSPSEVRYTVRNSHDWQFINGTWLEVYVANQARQCRDDQKQPLFTSCEMSLEIPGPSGARKEIDVACLYLGQLLHCSCKSEKSPFETHHLDELRAVSSLVGGRYCTRLFITNVFPPSPESQRSDSYQLFQQQAKDREIVVVTGDKLADMKEILRKEATNPTYRRM